MTAPDWADRDPLTIDPDRSGWTPGPDLAETPRPLLLRDCCGRPSDEHPKTDSTMRGQCHGPHAGTEISMHFDGRSYVCGLCALDAFHGGAVCAWCHQPILKNDSGAWYHRLSQSAECSPDRLGSSQATPSARGGAA